MPDPITFDELAIINQMMTGMGESPITDLTSTEPKVVVVNANYAAVKYFCMTKSNWVDFMAKKALNRLSGTPINRWTYAFQLPSDCLKVVTTWPPSTYQLMNRQLLSNEPTCQLDYIRNVEEAYWPAWFIRYVVAEGVVRMALGILRKEPTAGMINERDTALNDGYFLDAQQQPNQTVHSNDFVDCRN